MVAPNAQAVQQAIASGLDGQLRTYTVHLPNMDAAAVRERTAPLVKRLREAHPQTPILLVEDRVFTNAPFMPERQAFHRENHPVLREQYDALVAARVPHLHYLAGDELLWSDGWLAPERPGLPAQRRGLRQRPAHDSVAPTQLPTMPSCQSTEFAKPDPPSFSARCGWDMISGAFHSMPSVEWEQAKKGMQHVRGFCETNAR